MPSQVKDTTNKENSASEETSKKIKNTEEEWENSTDKKWPRWVLPIGIVLGVLLLVGIIAWIFRRKR